MSNVKLIEVYSSGHANMKAYSVRQIYINPTQVACLREEGILKRRLMEGHLIEGLDPDQSFVKITLNNGEDIVVIGPIEEIQRRLQIETREVLRG
jgi:hypothetical protein